jgi:hypothetical protein
MGRNLGDISTRAVENSSRYYTNTVAHELAVSAANIVASLISRDPEYDDPIEPKDFKGGIIEAKIEHDGERRIVIAKGTFEDVTNEVRVILSPSKFSKFAYYSGDEGDGIIYWMSKDTVWGPFHTQDFLYVSGRPVFYGKVTTKRGLKKQSPSDKPQFLGGFDKGNLPLPADGVNKIKDAALSYGGKVFSLISSATVEYQEFYLTFKGDSVNFKYNWRENVSGTWYNRVTNETVLTSNLTSNGVIFLDAKDKNGNVIDMRLKGVVDGRYSVGCQGSIWLDDDITYTDDPLTNPHSDDILGIIAYKDVIITENSANNDDINIHASIYTQKGGFTAQNYDDRAVSGEINLVGGIVQAIRKPVGTFDSHTQKITHGYSKRYKYDERLLALAPPYYPGTDKFEILSWYE